MACTDTSRARYVLIDGLHGVNIPYIFARKYLLDDLCVLNVTPSDIDELVRLHNDNDPDLWDLWQEIVDTAIIYDATNNIRYELVEDGDLFIEEI